TRRSSDLRAEKIYHPVHDNIASVSNADTWPESCYFSVLVPKDKYNLLHHHHVDSKPVWQSALPDWQKDVKPLISTDSRYYIQLKLLPLLLELLLLASQQTSQPQNPV